MGRSHRAPLGWVMEHHRCWWWNASPSPSEVKERRIHSPPPIARSARSVALSRQKGLLRRSEWERGFPKPRLSRSIGTNSALPLTWHRGLGKPRSNLPSLARVCFGQMVLPQSNSEYMEPQLSKHGVWKGSAGCRGRRGCHLSITPGSRREGDGCPILRQAPARRRGRFGGGFWRRARGTSCRCIRGRARPSDRSW